MFTLFYRYLKNVHNHISYNNTREILTNKEFNKYQIGLCSEYNDLLFISKKKTFLIFQFLYFKLLLWYFQDLKLNVIWLLLCKLIKSFIIKDGNLFSNFWNSVVYLQQWCKIYNKIKTEGHSERRTNINFYTHRGKIRYRLSVMLSVVSDTHSCCFTSWWSRRDWFFYMVNLIYTQKRVNESSLRGVKEMYTFKYDI